MDKVETEVEDGAVKLWHEVEAFFKKLINDVDPTDTMKVERLNALQVSTHAEVGTVSPGGIASAHAPVAPVETAAVAAPEAEPVVEPAVEPAESEPVTETTTPVAE